ASPSSVAGAPAASGGALYRIVSEQSEARYVAREKFVDRPFPNDAIGITKDVTGEIQLEQPNLLRGRILQLRVDLRTLASDSGQRDRIVRGEVLQTDQYPYAEFRSTEVAGPATYRPGEEASFQVPGMMKIRDQERPLTWDVQARLDGDALTGTGTASLKLSDFGIEPPRLSILTVEDAMRWEVRFSAERVP
ncbi:MAG: YceI family protein, partial [Chloroflexi bacterium]|nr:YceI family protein [Chloroflexota bacterium]